MTNDTLLLNISDGTAVITFNRPEARNALTLVMMRAFAGAVERLAGLCAAGSEVRAVVLTGAGTQAFCSGGDLLELSAHPSEDGARQMITLVGDALYRLEHLPVPVLAAVNGYALGGGAEITLACDLRVVDAQARIGFPQGRLALVPGWGGGQRLLRLVGYARALDYLLRAHTLDAAEMRAVGLATHVADEGKALDAARGLAAQFAAAPPDVVRATKTLLRAGLTRPYDEALHIERDLFPPLWAAEPHVQAVERFLSKKG